MTTLVIIGTQTINGVRYEHGSELPPNLLAREVIDQMLDNRQLSEYHSATRRSLYRIFAPLGDCAESEQLSQDERDAYCLPE